MFPKEDWVLELVSLRTRPDLRPQVFAKTFLALWPAFVVKDPTADLFFEQPHLDVCLDTAFAVVDPAQPDEVVGRAFAVPFAFGIPGREELPDSGWDGVVRWAHEDRALARATNALSALEITLLPSHRGRGASRIVLDAMRRRTAELSLRHMFAPVRPTAKALEPHAPMTEYAARTRQDGLPAEAWLRVHKLGQEPPEAGYLVADAALAQPVAVGGGAEGDQGLAQPRLMDAP